MWWDMVKEAIAKGMQLAGASGTVNAEHLGDADAFFQSIRDQFGRLNTPQVEGFNSILAAASAANWPTSYTADALATAWLETNQTMQPVREAYWLSENWRKNNLRYYPYYGRGYVQLTWERNYRKADAELGLEGQLIKNKDLAMRHDVAANIMIKGMEQGWFVEGRKLSRYLPNDRDATHEEFKQSRRIINGTDRWIDLANFAIKFQRALRVGKWKK